MPTFEELAWAALYFDVISEHDKDYVHVLSSIKGSFLGNHLQRNVKAATEFCNKWKCRLPKNCRSTLVDSLKKIKTHLPVLSTDKIETVNFTYPATIGADHKPKSSVIEYIYNRVRDTRRCGPTTTSKLLALVNSSLFVMWDTEILNYYHSRVPVIKDLGSGYVAFLQTMQNYAVQITCDFHRNYPKESCGPAVFLSKRLNYAPIKPLAKYLDEFNWVTITLEGKRLVPPSWHP